MILHGSDPCSLPVYSVSTPLGMHRYAVSVIVSLHCILVFFQPRPQIASSFSNIYLGAVCAWNFVYHSFFFISLGVFVFTFISIYLRVFWDLKVVWIPRGAQTMSILSLTPLIYGRTSIVFFSSSSFGSFCWWGSFRVLLMVRLVRGLGYPFAVNTISRCFSSSVLDSLSQSSCALSLRHWMTPLKTRGWWCELKLMYRSV